MNEIIRELRFEYSKEKTPVAIFKEYTLMLTAFEKAEFEIAKSISSSIRYKSSLEAVETGSIITKIKSWIEDKEPDLGNENLQKLNTQEYISNGIKTIVNNLTQDKNITKNTIERISSELNRLAEEFEINKIFSYAPVQQKNIIEVSKTIKEATSNLSDGEKVYLTEANGSNIELPKKNKYSGYIKRLRL